MSKILHPSGGAEDWQRFLAEPEKQWRTGYSAKALANCWEAADGFPPSVQALFDGSRFEELHGLEMLLGIPEHRVPLPGGRRASQTDLFVLARANDGLAAIAVEGKVAEPFGPLVREWIAATPSSVEGEPDIPPSEGKRERLAFLSSNLGLSVTDVADVRYQLVHRTVSALSRRAASLPDTPSCLFIHSASETSRSPTTSGSPRCSARMRSETSSSRLVFPAVHPFTLGGRPAIGPTWCSSSLTENGLLGEAGGEHGGAWPAVRRGYGLQERGQAEAPARSLPGTRAPVFDAFST